MHLSSHHAVFLEIHGAASISLHSYPVHGHPHLLNQAPEPAVLCGSGNHRLCSQLQCQRPDTTGPADSRRLKSRVWRHGLPHPPVTHLQCQQENPHPHSGHHAERILVCGSTVQSASRGWNLMLDILNVPYEIIIHSQISWPDMINRGQS